MGDNFVPPVKVLLKAINDGVKLATRISESAESAPAAQALQITESSKNLHKALERSYQAISEAYRRNVESCGEPFTKALVEDKLIQEQLKEIKNDVRDKIGEIDEDSFDLAACTTAEEQARICCTDCLALFDDLQYRIVQAGPSNSTSGPQDDRAQLSSRKQQSPPVRKALPSRATPSEAWVALKTSIAPAGLEIPPPVPPKPKSPWTIESPSQFEMGHVSALTQGRGSDISSVRTSSSLRRHSREISPGAVPLIPKEIVHHRLSANEEFLERRRRSRMLFQNELRTSIVSIGSIEENRASSNFAPSPMDNRTSQTFRSPIDTRVNQTFGPSPIISPALGSSGMSPIDGRMASSPVDGRGSRASLNGYDTLMTRQRSQGGTSQGTRSSRTSSILPHPHPDRQQAQRQDSQDSIFGLRAAQSSPPLSDRRVSGGSDHWGAPLATTLQRPGYGQGVEPGLEVVTGTPGFRYDEGMIVVGPSEEPASAYTLATPTTSLRSLDYPMRHDSSFYKFGGFCEGAKVLVRGEQGFKIVKRPSGHYSATVSARCIKCSYEVGWNDVEKDRLLDRSGIYGNSGIRWRQRFISKCHLKTNSIEEPMYACIFCIEDHKTVEEHDATVFFSVTQLFRHLATHPRPLPNVNGLYVLYGLQAPDVVDFDIHFTVPQPTLHTYCMREIGQKIATRPSGHAITTSHPKPNTAKSRDPAGEAVLHFASGARIVGITFPERFGGAWCIGYHDGERGSFPAISITLEMPEKEDIRMNDKSTLIAFAKWDFKPKEAKDGGWLQFKKGDKLSNIGYTFQDQWCWTGQNAKGKWGLFPAAFVENLQDGGNFGTSPGSIRTSRMPSFGIGSLGRNKSSRHERSGSIRSAGSAGNSNGMVQVQPGLEVVQSPILSAGAGWRPPARTSTGHV